MINGNAIFTDLQNYDVPWASDNINQQLDIMYYNHSSNKICGNYIVDVMGDNDALTPANRDTIAHMLYIMYGVNWSKLWNTANVEYNPIENYSMTETETTETDYTENGTNTGTVGNSGTSTTNNTGTVGNSSTEQTTGTIDYDKTEHTTGTIDYDKSEQVTGNSADNVYGFNSSSAVPSETSNATTTKTNDDTDTHNITKNNEDTETHNITKTNSSTETLNTQDATVTNNTETRNLADSNTGSNSQERTLTRAGNIGVTTSQQMLQSERELWMWSFFNTVFEDIDKMLCLSVY